MQDLVMVKSESECFNLDNTLGYLYHNTLKVNNSGFQSMLCRTLICFE